jgi:hypothetical protein
MKTQRATTEASRKATRALACFVSGIGAALLGTVLTVVAWVQGAEAHPWLRGVGTAFLVLIIPLLILVGFYLDDMEQGANGRTLGKPRERERGSVFVLLLSVTTLLLVLMLVAPVELRAQQTIFNVPTTDVLDRGKVYGELDVPFKTSNDPANLVPRFSSFVTRVVVGVGNGVEVGLNLTGNINPGPDATTFVPAIKYKADDGGDNGWAVVFGDNVFIPVRNRSYDIGNYFYAQASKTFKTKTRITAGGYHFSDDVVAAAAQRAGGQFGIEHPVTSSFGLAADWYTGKHAAGYLTPGVIFKPHSRVTGYAGYLLGNTRLLNGNHFFLLELGYNFN